MTAATLYRGGGRIVLPVATDTDVIRVYLDRECEACEGYGWVTHPLWREYGEWVAQRTITRARGEGRDYQAENAWWIERVGCGPWLHAEHDGCPVPPEEEKCGECKGVGSVPTEAGRALLAFVQRYGGA